ncbi:MAG TPA: DUF559 domain-containing protein [Polyangiaceae bacterium]
MRPPKPNPKGQNLLEHRAHAMRHTPTESEAALFRLLSGKQLGVAFKRQVPLGGRYIGDFVAASTKLVVEVDGGAHARRQQADARRDRFLHRLGYRVLRLEAQLVLEQPLVAVERIRRALGQS